MTREILVNTLYIDLYPWVKVNNWINTVLFMLSVKILEKLACFYTYVGDLGQTQGRVYQPTMVIKVCTRCASCIIVYRYIYMIFYEQNVTFC